MMRNTIAWTNGQWLPVEQVHLAFDDWGLMQGAIVVDRLRTMDTQPLDLPTHLARLKLNCASLGISGVNFHELGGVIQECARLNHSHVADRDFAMVVLVTPGRQSAPSTPTQIVHIQPLKWSAFRHWYTNGQQLLVSQHRNVPAACWSPQLKTRARLQYYLADQEAIALGEPHASAVLLDTAGCITETSAANLILVDAEGAVCCAPAESILDGISLRRTLRLAVAAGWKIVRQPIELACVEFAREILLTGTSAGIWPASQFGKMNFPQPTLQPFYCELRDRWIADVGFNFCQQAIDSAALAAREAR